MPSTVRGAALTVGGMLSNVKQYNEELVRKKEEKKQRKIRSSQQARDKAVRTSVNFDEAKRILAKNDNDKGACSKALRVKHLRALLLHHGADPDVLKNSPRKPELLSLFWSMTPSGIINIDDVCVHI